MKFWSDVWSKSGDHAEDTEWLARIKRKLGNVEKQKDLIIDFDCSLCCQESLEKLESTRP